MDQNRLRVQVRVVMAEGLARGWTLRQVFKAAILWMDQKGFEPPVDLQAFLEGRVDLLRRAGR